MQVIRFSELPDYLDKADAYTSPKTIKIVEAFYREGSDYRLRGITFPLTFQIEWSWASKEPGADVVYQNYLAQLKEHGHSLGKISELNPRLGV